MASGDKRQDVRKLAEKLDKEIDDMMEKKAKKNGGFKYEDGFTEDNIDDILSTNPAFMNSTPTQEQIDENPYLQALQQLKYEDADDTPEEKALTYKDDGNWHFKHKLYAKAVRAYTGGLGQKCSDSTLISTLYSNRAAAHFYLKNYRSSVKDSLEALKLEPNKVKSLMRCAQCCDALSKHSDTIVWLKKVLSLEPNHKAASEMVKRAQNELKIAERDRRKKERELKLHNTKMKALVDAIRGRGIKLNLVKLKQSPDDDSLSLEDSLILRSVDTSNPSHAKVHFEDDKMGDSSNPGKLVWPVLFTYPEHGISEIIEEFCEGDAFLDHFDVMFEEKAPWDADGLYKVENLELYHEINSKSLRFIQSERTLRDVLSAGEIVVTAGTPVFIVLCRASPFRNIFLSKYSLMR